MSRWLKFSDLVINPRHISRIYITPEKIDIKVECQAHSGSFSGSFLFMSGSIDTKYKDWITLTKKDNAGAYKIVEKWIHEL